MRDVLQARALAGQTRQIVEKEKFILRWHAYQSVNNFKASVITCYRLLHQLLQCASSIAGSFMLSLLL